MNQNSINNRAPHRKNLRLFYKAVALTLCVCLLVTDIVQAAPEIRESWFVDSESIKSLKPKDQKASFELPAKLGNVEEIYISPRSTIHNSLPTIYYIQDAHDSLDAQKNIARIIQYLVRQEGVKTVFEEGYEGPVPTDKYFAGIRDPEVKRKVAQSLLRKMLIGGAEYAHITRFLEVGSSRLEVRSDKKESLKTKPIVISQEATAPPGTQRSRPTSNFELPAQRDFQLIGADNVRLHLENIEWYRQSSLTRKTTHADLQDLAARLQVLADREFPKSVKAWMKLRKRFDDGELDLMEYLKRLTGIAFARNDSNAAPTGAFPHISIVLRAEYERTPESLKEVQTISHRKLFSEIDQLENTFAEQTLLKPTHQTIFRYGKILSQLQRLNTLEVSFEEYKTVQDVLKTFRTETLLSFIASQTDQSLALSKKWETDIHRVTRFYELAEERDLAIEKNLLKFRLEKKPVATLVFGGFHKDNIKEMLRRNGYSYVVIAPKIKKIDKKEQTLYRELMSRGVPGFSLSTIAHLATRYAPIFEVGEYLNQAGRVQALIRRETNRINARSELRKPAKKSVHTRHEIDEALKWVAADKRFQIVETENARYVIYHRKNLSRQTMPKEIFEAMDAIALTKPAGNNGALPTWLEQKASQWFLDKESPQQRKKIYAVGVEPQKINTFRGLGNWLFKRTLAPILLSILIYSFGVNAPMAAGAAMTFFVLASIGPAYAPVKYKTPLMNLAAASFFTPFYGLTNAIVSYRLELFVAPRLKKDLGRKPLILLDADGSSYGPIGSYLKSARLRKRVMTFHRWVGFLSASKRAILNHVGLISSKRVGAQDPLLLQSENERRIFYHVYDFKPSKSLGVPASAKKTKNRRWVNRIKDLLPLMDWLPKPTRSGMGTFSLENLLEKFDLGKQSLQVLESRLSKARPDSRDSFIRWMALLDEWRYRVLGTPPKPNFDDAFYSRIDKAMTRLLLNELSEKDALDELVKASAQALGIQRAASILRKPFLYFLRVYQQSVKERIWRPLEDALVTPPREPANHSWNQVFHSDFARLPLSTPFWMLIGSFIQGATLGAVFGFLVHYVFRPLYDRMQVSSESQLWNPLKPQVLLGLREASTWDDVRLAYQEVMARSLEGENFTLEFQLEVLSRIIKKAKRSDSLEALIVQIKKILLEDSEKSLSQVWESIQEKRESQGISKTDPGFMVLSEVIGLSKNKPSELILIATMTDETQKNKLVDQSQPTPTQPKPVRELTIFQAGLLSVWLLLKENGWADSKIPGYKKTTPVAKSKTVTQKTVQIKKPAAPKGPPRFKLFLYHSTKAGHVLISLVGGLFIPAMVYFGARIFQLRNTARHISNHARKKAATQGLLKIASRFFKEPLMPRSWTENNPVIQTAGSERLSEEIYDYLEALKIPEVDALVLEARKTLRFKFEAYRDRTWYPFAASSLDRKEFLTWGSRRTELDLNSGTLVMHAKWPVFLKAIVFLHLAPYLFQHKIIPGHRSNLHMPNEAYLAARKKILWAVGRKLLKEELRDFSNRPESYVRPPFVHLLRILPAYLNLTVYSDGSQPGVLYQRTYGLAFRGFIKAREGFTLGAYHLAEALLKRPVMVVTDQKSYPIESVKTKATFAKRLFGFLKPLWPAAKHFALALTKLAGFVGIFGGIFLSLDLSFLEPLWTFIRDVFSQIPLLGPIFAMIFDAITATYYFLKDWVGAFLGWFGLDWKALRESLNAFWQWLMPLREWIQLVLIPFVYRWAIPVILFFVGMVNGYAVYKVNLRKQLIRGADALTGFIIRGVAKAPFLLLGLIQMVLTGSLDAGGAAMGGGGEELAGWIENTRVIRLYREKLLPQIVNLFYAALSVFAVVFYVFPLMFLAYPPAEFQMVFHTIHSLGIPMPPIVAVYAIAVFVGIPFSYFYAFHAFLIKRAFVSKRVTAKKLFFGMTTLLSFVTVIFPVMFSWFYQTNPMRINYIYQEKESYIDHWRWGLREGYRRINDYVASEHKDLDRKLRESLETNLEERSGQGGDAGKRMAEELQKELSKSSQVGALETMTQFLGRILPEDFKGYEDVVHPRTGYPVHILEVKEHAPEILNHLKTHHHAVYGNSFFFSDILRGSPYPLRDLRQTFGDEGAQQIIEHLMDIIDGKVIYPNYPETYSARQEALRAIRQIYFFGFGFRQRRFFPVTEEDQKRFDEEEGLGAETPNAHKAVMMDFPKGTFYLRAANWDVTERAMMSGITQRFFQLKSEDLDIERSLNASQNDLGELQVLKLLSDEKEFKTKQDLARQFWQNQLDFPAAPLVLVKELSRDDNMALDIPATGLIERILRLDLQAYQKLLIQESSDPQAVQKWVESYLTIFNEGNVSLADVRKRLLDQFSAVLIDQPEKAREAVTQLLEVKAVRVEKQLKTYFESRNFGAEEVRQKEQFAVMVGEAIASAYEAAAPDEKELNNVYWLDLLMSHDAMSRTQVSVLKKLAGDLEQQMKKQRQLSTEQENLKERVDRRIEAIQGGSAARSEVRVETPIEGQSEEDSVPSWVEELRTKLNSPEYGHLKKLEKQDGAITRISRSWALIFLFLMMIQNSDPLVQHPERLVYLTGGLVLSGMLGNLFVPKSLRTGGAFGVMQHPIYLFKMVTLAAMIVHLPTFASAGLFFSLGAWVVWRMYFEYEQLRFKYGEPYEEYWKRTPLILPFTLWVRPFWKKPVQALQRWLQPTPVEKAPEQILSTEVLTINETPLIEEAYDFFRAVKHSAVWGWYGKAVFNFPLTVMEHRLLGWLAISWGTTLALTELRGMSEGHFWSWARFLILPGTMWFLSFLHFKEWRRARFIYQKALRYNKETPQVWHKARLERAHQFEATTGWTIDWTSDPLALAVMNRQTRHVAMTVGWIMPDLTSAEGRSANSYFRHTLRLMQTAIEKEEMKTKKGEARSEVRSTEVLPQPEEARPLFQFPARRVERALLKFQSDFPPGVLEQVRELLGQIRGQALTLETLKQKLPEPLGAAQKRIVFTGAPYGGKTTFVTAMSERYADEVVVIPEVIHILKEAGLDLSTVRGQRIVYALKYLLEQAAARVYPERIVFLDRGTLDGAAYWPEGRDAFLREIGGQRGELERYGAVIQMQSVVTTQHAVTEYRDRVESKDRAAEIERELEAVWRNHGRYYRVPHSEWSEKTRQAETIIDFVKSRLLAGMKAPLVFDFEHEGQHYHYPNIAAYDFDPKTLESFLSRHVDTGVQAPLVMDLHFKAPCGLRCVFCYTEGGVTDERHAIDEEKFGTMEPEDIREAIRQYAALGGHTLILLSIGEPLTDVNQFIEYAQLAQQLGVRVVTFTNMLLITPEVAERLRKAEVNMLLKLNHLDPAMNNQLAGRAKPYKYVEYQGQKIPQQLVNVLEAYRDRPDLLAISSDITRMNADNILAISRWAYEALGVSHFRKHLYYFGFAQANRDLLVLSDEEALAFDKKVYAFDRQYGYEYPAPEKFSDQYSFDMRRFLNNNVNVSGFPVRTFAHYLSGIYHSSEVVKPKYGYKKGVRIALKNNSTGKVDGEDFFRQIFRHILFFKGVSKRLGVIEDSFQSDRARQLDHLQTQASRQQRWDEAYLLTVDIKKYLAENGEDLAVPDRRRLLKILKRATELARENVLYWVPKNPGITVIANDQLRTAYPAGEKFQFFSLEGESVFYTDPYQVTYSVVPPGHEQAIHGHFFTRELSVALDPGLRFHLFQIENGRVAHRDAYDVPEFSGAAFGIRTPHSLLNPTEQPIRNMTVKYGAQVTDRWDLKEAPDEDTFTFEGGVTAPLIEKAGSAVRYTFDKGDLYHRVVVLNPGEVYPYELAAGADKGWFVVEGTAKVSAPLLEAQNVSAEPGSIIYAKGSDKPGMVLFSNESSERLVMADVDLKESLVGRFQSAIAKTYQALITDVDGVLTEPGSGKISEQALKFLTEKIQQGIPILLISGRNETAFGQGYRKQAPSLEEVAVKLRKLLTAAGNEEALEHLFLSSENGVVISNGFNREDPRRINYPTGFEAQTLALTDQTSLIDGLKALGLVDEHVRVENKTHGFVLKDSFGTRVAGIAQELVKELKARELWDSFEVFAGQDEGAVYVYPRGSNKRRGLDFMVKFFGFNFSEVAVFADRGGMGEQDHELLEGAAGFSTDTVSEEGKTINLRALSGYLPGYQSFMWVAEQLKFVRPNDLPHENIQRSEVRARNSKGPRRIRMLTPERAEKINAWFEDRFDLFKKVNDTGEKAGSYRAVVRLEIGADSLRLGQPRIEDERWVLPIIYDPKIDIPLSEALRFITPIMESLVRAKAQDRAKIRWQQLSFSLEHPKSFKQIQQLEQRFLQAPDKITWDDLDHYVREALAITNINATSEAMTLPKFPGINFFPKIYKVRGDQLSLRIITYDADTSQIHAVAIHAFDVYHSQQKGSGWRMEDSVEEMLLAQRLQNLLEKRAKKETGDWVIENKVRRAEVQDLPPTERQAVLDSIEDIHRHTGLDLEGLTKDLRREFDRVYPDKQKLFMIARGGVDVGYALVSPQRDRGSAAIYALYVRKDWANKGIFELLLDQIFNDLKRHEIQTVSWLINLDEQELLNLTDQRIEAGQLSLTSASVEVGQQGKYTRVTKENERTLSEFLKRVQEIHGDKASWDQDYKPGVEVEWTILNPEDSAAARSEIRNEVSKIKFEGDGHNKDIRDMTTPVAVFLDAGELARFRPEEADQRMDELLALLSQSKGLDIYLDGTDRYPIESIKNKKFQQMLDEYSDRFHIGVFDRARLVQKKIVIQAALWASDESAAATDEKITKLKQHYKIAGDVLPLEYIKPGALKVFLSLAELGTAAELIRKISDDYAVRGRNGRWQIGEAYLASIWEDFAAHTAVAWAA